MWAPDEDGYRDAGLTLYYDENTFIKFGIKDRCLFVREYVDNAYVRCLEQDFEPGSSHVYLKIVTEGLSGLSISMEPLSAFWITLHPFVQRD